MMQPYRSRDGLRRAQLSVWVLVVVGFAWVIPAHAQVRTSRRDETTTETTEDTTTVDRDWPRWELSLNGQVGAPRGFVKVGEFDRSGSKLALHDDLGIDTFEVAAIDAAYHLTPRDVIRGEFAYTFLYGTTQLTEDQAFNGALLAGGTELRTRPVFTRGTFLYEHDLIHRDDGALLAIGGGLTFTYLHFKLHGTLSENTIGHETQEDFYAQELPIPLMSLRGEYPITPWVHLLGTVDGGLLPKVDSLRNEGGSVKLAQAHADAFAGLRFVVTPHVLVDTGYRYTYFSQHETSGEDDNKILFLGQAFGFGVTFVF